MSSTKNESTDKPSDKKKQILLRISESLWKELASWADSEFRSINGQVEYLLTQCVQDRKKNSKR
jgi:hypothetical protein